MFSDEASKIAKPGQFLMLWIPGIDEIPLSILGVSDDGLVSVLVRKSGEATSALIQMRKGDTIGVRGPFGRSFTVQEGNLLLVGGGTGIAPLLFLTHRVKNQEGIVFVMGAKDDQELTFKSELEELSNRGDLRFIATTEDGSYGIKGLCTVPLRQVLAKEKFVLICTCGPELMMRAVFDLAEEFNVNIEASMERLMRCAIGLCGSCTIGKYQVCRDGPVFNVTQLREIKEEFGHSKLDFDGRRIPLL